MPTITVKCPTPGCEGTEFNETSMVPASSPILAWELRGGVPHPDSYGSANTYYEGEELDDKPYECTDCQKIFKADELIVVKED